MTPERTTERTHSAPPIVAPSDIKRPVIKRAVSGQRAGGGEP